MLRKRYKIPMLLFCLMGILSGAFAQYKVTGGSKTPLLANDDTKNRIQVYMVYGTSNVEISYTSSSTAHQWYRYKTKALEAEKINSVQSGTTSTIRGIEDGYGYYVQETGTLARYVWIIDYSKHAFDISSMQIADSGNPCLSFRLAGQATMDPLSYVTPNGDQIPVNRTFDITYSTLEWREADKRFIRKDEIKKVEGDPFATNFTAPLCDTYIRLAGDSFAQYFEVGKTAQIDNYSAVALEIHADTLLTSPNGQNNDSSAGELSAPANILFRAYGNDPVAARYSWKIFKKSTDGNQDKMLVSYLGEEVEYEFTEAGSYYANLEVNDRTGKCTDTSNRFDFVISDYFINIPNAFSPGTTPGLNDEFRVEYKSIVRFKGWIFNRWGNEMFRWTDPSQGWDGKKGGKYVAPGVYYYVIEFEGSDGKKQKRSGDINILRPKTINDEINK